MRRYAVPLVITGSIAVLAALVFLLRAISSESPAATVTAPTKPQQPGAPSAPVPTATTPAAPTPTGPAARVPPPPRPTVADDPWAPPTAGAAATEDAPPATKLNTKNLEWGAPQIRELILANEPHVRECISTHGDKKTTGEATVTYIVVSKNDKVFIEQTDYDRDKTTIQNEALVECLHKTAQHMKFAGLPRQAEAIIVTRGIRVQDGSLDSDQMVRFNYIR